MKAKAFDCVEMKRRGAELVRGRLAGMTLEQEIEYWRLRSEQFEQDQQRLRAQAAAASTTGSRPVKKTKRATRTKNACAKKP
jgi:predicted aconitase